MKNKISVSKMFLDGIIVITIIGVNIGDAANTTYSIYFLDSIIGISSNKTDVGFLESFFKQRKIIKRIAINIARENLNLEIIKNLKISFISISEQKQIFLILKNLDYKINNLQLKNKFKKLRR